jgi:hypothetical protein
MEESAEQVASTHGAPVILGADGRPGQRIWYPVRLPHFAPRTRQATFSIA